jgi:hypothetical protein
MPLTQEERRDLGLLRNLLQVIGAFLSWLVGDSPFIPAELRQAFIRVLPLVSLRLANAASELEGIETTDSHLRRRLDDAGLVGDALSLKRDIWERTTAASFATAATGFFGRMLRPLLKLINSILGRFVSVFPALELVKEYKDSVEFVIEDQRQGDRPPNSIYNL